jgi:arsenate reductase (thioredoxin)
MDKKDRSIPQIIKDEAVDTRADIDKLKEAIRENTKQLEKLTEQVRQISQATTIWGFAKSPDFGVLDEGAKIPELLSTVIDKMEMGPIKLPPHFSTKAWLERQKEAGLEDKRVFAALDNARKDEKTTVKPKTVLFACIHNAGRSQMAAALFDYFADLTKASAISAGSQPAPSIYPNVIAVMKEIGCDLTYASPLLLTKEIAKQADLFASMGCDEAGCPIIPVERLAWQIEDPKDQPIEKVRQIRDQIQAQVLDLLVERGWLAEWARPDFAETEVKLDNKLNVPYELQREGLNRLRNDLFSTETTPKLIITPKEIEWLILWQAYRIRTTISQSPKIEFYIDPAQEQTDYSLMKEAVAKINDALHNTFYPDVPEEHRATHIRFMAYSRADQEMMIEEVLMDNEVLV